MVVIEHTFLFTDIVGFTALTTMRGDDQAADLAHRFYHRVRALLPDHRAEEVKTIGDALMLRADDPAQAIQLGLRIARAFGRDPDDPEVRVGVHTGPAVARDGDWYGASVNLAARLCAAAPAGGVLVSETTTAAAGDVDGVGFARRKRFRLKNISGRVGASTAREAVDEAGCSVPRSARARLVCPYRSARAIREADASTAALGSA